MLSILSDIVTVVGGATFVGGLLRYLKTKKFEKELSFIEIIDSFNSSVEAVEQKLNIIDGWDDYNVHEEADEILQNQLDELKLKETRSQKSVLYFDVLATFIRYSDSLTMYDIFEDNPYIIGELLELLSTKSKNLLSTYKTDEILKFRKYCIELSNFYLSIHRGDLEEEDFMRYKELNLIILDDMQCCLENYLGENK